MNWGILKIAAIVLFICVLHMSHCADVLNQAKPTNGPNVVSENDIDNANIKQDSGKKPILPPTTSTTSAVKLTTSSVKQISQKPKEASGTNSSCNGTSCGKQLSGLESFMQKVKESKGMLLRTLYVLMGVTSIVIIYFVVRAWSYMSFLKAFQRYISLPKHTAEFFISSIFLLFLSFVFCLFATCMATCLLLCGMLVNSDPSQFMLFSAYHNRLTQYKRKEHIIKLLGGKSLNDIVFGLHRLRRRSKTKRYGLITSRGTDMEMEPLDADDDDDDDDDMTVFELNKRRKK